MNWNWKSIHDAFASFGSSAVFVLVLLGVIVAAAKILKFLFGKKQRPEVKMVHLAADYLGKALDKALEEDVPRKPNPNYSYAEFRKDLFDRGLTFDEIYEKSGGIFPKKPEEGQFGPQGHQGPMTLGADGGGPCDGANGYQGFQGPDGRCPDRMSELQLWFSEQGKKVHTGQVVPPPPNPYPIIHKIYIRGRR